VGLGFDPIAKKLWILDWSHCRLRRVSSYDDTQAGLLVDMVIGQSEKSGASCNGYQQNPSANKLCGMSQIEFDRLETLYVVESGYECHANDRITMYPAEYLRNARGLIPNLSAGRTFVNDNFDQPASCKGNKLTGPFSPVSIAFNSRNQMVVGNDDKYRIPEGRHLKQLWLYRNPLKKNSDANFDRGKRPMLIKNCRLALPGRSISMIRIT
jgi:hypothetical protein